MQARSNLDHPVSEQIYYHFSYQLQPQFLIGTAGCIGAGLDCHDVHLVTSMGIPMNLINFIQEMGCCGRSVPSASNATSTIDSFNIVFSINDFLYIHKRINDEENDSAQGDCTNMASVAVDESDLIISKKNFKDMELRNFMKLCRMLFLNLGCWYYYLEMPSSHPQNDPYDPRNYDPCFSHCPYCTNEIANIVKVVDRHQLSLFLVCVRFYTNV